MAVLDFSGSLYKDEDFQDGLLGGGGGIRDVDCRKDEVGGGSIEARKDCERFGFDGRRDVVLLVGSEGATPEKIAEGSWDHLEKFRVRVRFCSWGYTMDSRRWIF